MSIIHEELTRLLHYDPETGIFTWKVSQGTVKAGAIAGTVNSRGYVSIQVNGRLYRGHRLAWYYIYGVWPIDELDHRDKDRTNNRIINLRECGHLDNCSNQGMNSRNTSGYKGVSWKDSKQKWFSCLRKNKHYYYIGFFDCPIEAAKAYDRKVLEVNGDFAVTNASLGLI